MSEAIDIDEEGNGLETAEVVSLNRGPWQRQAGKRGRLSREEMAAKAAWEAGQSNDTASTDVIATSEQPEAKKRGSRVKREASLDQFAQLLLMVHASFSLVVPEMALDQNEADMLTSSLAELSKHYHVPLDGKHGAIFSFITTCGIVYGTRTVAVVRRIRNERNTNSPAS